MRPKIDHAICRISQAQNWKNIFSFARVEWSDTPRLVQVFPPGGFFGMWCSPPWLCHPSSISFHPRGEMEPVYPSHDLFWVYFLIPALIFLRNLLEIKHGYFGSILAPCALYQSQEVNYGQFKNHLFPSSPKEINPYFYFCNQTCFELPHGYQLRKFSLDHPKGIQPFPPFLLNSHHGAGMWSC